MSEEWLEIRARSEDDAMAAAIAELGLASADQVELEVVEEPQKGVLGFGGKDGLFRVSRKQEDDGRRRRRSRGRGGSGGRNGGSGEGRSSKAQGSRGNGGKPKGDGGSGGSKERTPRPASEKRQSDAGDRPPRKPRTDRSRSGGDRAPRPDPEPRREEGTDMPNLEEQAKVVDDFLVGLLEAFGLEGVVETSVEGDDIIIANVTGEQAEALIGPKGAILQAILELARTVVQRKTQAGARLRLDIGGYTHRRREALRIYAGRLAQQVADDGEEIMLEPMNPADRKVVHDVVAEVDGVRSYSEGEEPRRSVVISPAARD